MQARPQPLTGAGLTQNLHQVAVDETVKKVGECVHEDGERAFQGADKDTGMNADICQM